MGSLLFRMGKDRTLKWDMRRQNFKDETGKKYGRLTVIRYHGNVSRNRGLATFLCRCDCGKEIVVCGQDLRRGHTKSCGCLNIERCKSGWQKFKKHNPKKGSKHPNWNGGRILDRTHGYIKVLKPGHPNADSKNYVLEHVLVMSKFLGRPIAKDETIHHKNGDRADNRLSNLELWNNSHPSGQRVKDKMKFCRDFLERYEGKF